MKNKIKEHNIIKGNQLVVQSIDIDSQDLQAEVEAEITLLAVIAPDWFDSKLFRNAFYSSSLIDRKMKKKPRLSKTSRSKTK